MARQTSWSRRSLLTGLAVVIGAAAALAVPTTAATATSADGTRVGVGPVGSTVFTFVGRIEQDGPLIVNVGYLTSIEGMDTADLFTGDDPLERSAETARFTYFTSGLLEERSVVKNLFTTSGSAETTFHYRVDGGADLDDPSTFRDGEEIATTTSAWHNLVNVQAPNVGILTATSDDVQDSVTGLALDVGTVQFGSPGNRFHLTFSGHGVRTDADAPRATLDYSGQAIEAADDVAMVAGGSDSSQDDDTSPLPLALAVAALVAAGAALVVGLRRRPA